MKTVFRKRFVFIAQSMLWSILLYAVMMLALNWDDISNKVRGANPITVISNIPVQRTPAINPALIPPSISRDVSIIKGIIDLAKNISGITFITPRH